MNDNTRQAATRVAIVGLGHRGRATLSRYMALDDVRVVALADLDESNLHASLDIISGRDWRPDTYASPYGWQSIAERDDVDLMVICTDWQSHTPIAAYAMRQGRNVAIEVPAATTIDECRLLVSTAQQTGRTCAMLENCCFDPFHLGTLALVQDGSLGEVTHCAGAYIHDLSPDIQNGTYRDSWMPRYVATHCGNPYPTHGLGPVCQLLGIDTGDDTLLSVYSAGTAVGGLNHSIITTQRGRTITLDYDVTTPRPYNRRQTVCGTKGFVEKYPTPTLCMGGTTLTGDDATEAVIAHVPQRFKEIMQRGEQLAVPNMMNYIMDVCLLRHLQRGDSFPSVRDAALWSAFGPLTEESARSGQAVAVPQF